MPFLKQLAIEAERQNKNLLNGKFFRSTTHHIKEIFAYFLPKKFMLDGSSKFQLTLCNDDFQMSYKVILGVCECQVGNFNFSQYAKLPKIDQEAMISDLLLSAILNVGSLSDTQIEAIKGAYEKTLVASFYLRYEVEKLRKRILGTDVKIFRKLSYEVGESWEAQVEKNGEIISLLVIRENGYVDLRDLYQKAFLEASNYFIKDRFNKVVFSIDESNFDLASIGARKN